jgi:hypothetical protein
MGIPPKVTAGHLKEAVTKQRNLQQQRAEDWLWIIRRLQEGASASNARQPPAHKHGWIGWRQGLLKHINRMHSQGTMHAAMRTRLRMFLLQEYPHGTSQPAELLTLLQRKHKQVLTEVRADSRQEWQRRLQDEVTKGTGWAHRVTKPPHRPGAQI